jgi:phospholipid/cholesterol/gamma-HCH transport system substrate-binding protein
VRRRLSGPVPALGRVAVAAQMVVAMAFVVFLLRAEGVTLPFTGAGEFTLRAAFTDVGGIHGGELTPVLVSGVPVGKVTGVEVQNGQALVTMNLGASARGVVRRDARAAIEPRSALEDMTIDITPGSPDAPAARPGMLIPSARTEPTTTLDQVISVLDLDTRAQLEILIDQLARGIGGRAGQLRAAVAKLHSVLDPASAVAAALSRRRVLISDAVAELSQVGSAAERHDLSLAQALSSAASTLAVTAGHESSIAASVRGLPGTMASLDRALTGIRGLAAPLVPTLTGLRSTANALPAALRSVRDAVPAASSLLAAADAFARHAGPGLSAATGVLGALEPTASSLTPEIARVEPIVSAVNARRQGIGLLGERFSGVLSTNDANGPILRGLGTFEPFNAADFGFPSANGQARSTLAARAAKALTLTCLHGQLVACLIRYLVPGLPGSVR